MPLFCSGICARELVEVALSKRDIIVCGRACPLFRSGMRASQLVDIAPVGSRRPVDDRCNRRRVAGGRQLVGGRPAGRVLLSECASRSNDVAVRAYSLRLRAAGAIFGKSYSRLDQVPSTSPECASRSIDVAVRAHSLRLRAAGALLREVLLRT